MLTRDAQCEELRCACGSLMARVTTHGIELKCRRCKRVVVVAAARARRGWTEVHLHTQVHLHEETGMRR